MKSLHTSAIVSILAAANLCAAVQPLDSLDRASPGDTVIIPPGIYTQPIVISKPVTLEGAGAIFKIHSNQPAIQINTSKAVILKNIEIEYQPQTKPQKGEFPYAIYTSGGDLLIENCNIKEVERSGETPCAVSATDRSTLCIRNSRFEGFNYTIQFWNQSKGSVEDCLIIHPGHCGITIGEGASASLNRNIVTGSRYHGIRCTGGEIHADSNLVIGNKNRGFYIGNKSSTGTLSNNLIIDNTTGINVYANSRLDIINNVILRSTYAGLAIANTTTLHLEGNVIANNEKGVIGFSAEKDATPSICLRGANIVFENVTQTEGIKQPSEMAGLDPQFTDPNTGLFSMETSDAKGMGLSDPTNLQKLWRKWQAAMKR